MDRWTMSQHLEIAYTWILRAHTRIISRYLYLYFNINEKKNI